MERISRIERKTNERVLRTIKEKRTFMNAIGVRCSITIGHILRHPEELRKIIIKQIIIIERKNIAGHP